MDNTLLTLSCGGVFLLLSLLALFEILDRRNGGPLTDNAYVYYTHDHTMLRILHTGGRRYKIYVPNDACPVPTKQDRYGTYFPLHASSATHAEAQIDALYRSYQNHSYI